MDPQSTEAGFFVIWFIGALLSWFMGWRRGRPVVGGLVGFVFGFVGVFIMLFVPKTRYKKAKELAELRELLKQ